MLPKKRDFRPLKPVSLFRQKEKTTTIDSFSSTETIDSLRRREVLSTPLVRFNKELSSPDDVFVVSMHGDTIPVEGASEAAKTELGPHQNRARAQSVNLNRDIASLQRYSCINRRTAPSHEFSLLAFRPSGFDEEVGSGCSPVLKIRANIYKYRKLIIITLIVETLLTLLYAVEGSNIQFDAYLTLVVTSVTLIALMNEVAPAFSIFLFAVMILLLFGVLDTNTAFQGFSNEVVIAIALLYSMARGVAESSVLSYVIKYALRKPKSLFSAQIRLLVPMSIISSVMNNTPLVAMMIPVVEDWSRSLGFSSSHLLMPLSFAVILGGTCSTIGTSVNLIGVSLIKNLFPKADVDLFGIGFVGIFMWAAGITYMLLLTSRLLPDQESTAEMYIKTFPCVCSMCVLYNVYCFYLTCPLLLVRLHPCMPCVFCARKACRVTPVPCVPGIPLSLSSAQPCG